MASKLSGYLAELKRRKVYHVGVVYVVVGAGIIGLADAALPSWEQLQVPVVVLILVGFPIALVLAWAYEVRPEERPGPELTVQPAPPPPEAAPTTEFTAAAHPASIVVLPFDNLSPDPDDAYFSDGLTEEIISDLSCLKSLRVISRTSAMLLKGSGKDVRTIGRDLSVRYVLEGSVRKAGERLRVTAQLIDATADVHVWSERYDALLGDVFTVQENLARSIAQALQVELSPAEQRALATPPVPDTRAYEYLLRARHEIWTGMEASVRRAIEYLESAQETVGENVAILSALGEAHFLLPHVTGEGIDDLGERIGLIADRILRLDPNAAAGHFNKGLSESKRRWGAKEAMQHFRRATELDPNDTTVLMFRAFWAAQTGWVDEGLDYCSAAVSIDPLGPGPRIARGYCLMFAGEHEASVEAAESGFRMVPTSTYYRLFLMVPLAQAGEIRRVAALAQEISDSPGDNWGRVALILDASLRGRSAGSLFPPELLQAARHDETFSWIFAQCFAQLGRKEEALQWLENGIAMGFVNPKFLGEEDVLLNPLREEPRFLELLATAREVSQAVRLVPQSS